MNVIFVYGTLKKGFPNHSLIDGCKYLGEHTIKGFEMYDLGFFPAIVKSNDKYKIKAEAYEVPNEIFEKIDGLEGYPIHYDRIIVKSEEGLNGWIYYYRHRRNISQRAIRIKSGIYRR